jgi:CDGSH-type Zn-finger protein
LLNLKIKSKPMETPKIAQKMPYVLDLKPGKYYWCACGQSKNQPLLRRIS